MLVRSAREAGMPDVAKNAAAGDGTHDGLCCAIVVFASALQNSPPALYHYRSWIIRSRTVPTRTRRASVRREMCSHVVAIDSSMHLADAGSSARLMS